MRCNAGNKCQAIGKMAIFSIETTSGAWLPFVLVD